MVKRMMETKNGVAECGRRRFGRGRGATALALLVLGFGCSASLSAQLAYTAAGFSAGGPISAGGMNSFLNNNYVLMNAQLTNLKSTSWTNAGAFGLTYTGGVMAVGNSGTSGYLYLDGDGTATYPVGVKFFNQGAWKASLGLAYGANNWVNGSATGDLVVSQSDPTKKILFGTGANPTMVIANNQVSIGTNNPDPNMLLTGYTPGGDARLRMISGTVKMDLFASTNGSPQGYIGTASNHPLAFRTSDNNRVIISEAGSVYISGKVGIGFAPPSGADTLAVAGNVTLPTGSFFANGAYITSDQRLKKDIVTFPAALDKLATLRGVIYKWIDPAKGTRTQYGVIAQEVEPVYPELVDTNDKGMKSVNYNGFVAPFIEAIKELKTQNDSLKAENAELKKRLDAIEKKLGLQ